MSQEPFLALYILYPLPHPFLLSTGNFFYSSFVPFAVSLLWLIQSLGIAFTLILYILPFYLSFKTQVARLPGG